MRLQEVNAKATHHKDVAVVELIWFRSRTLTGGRPLGPWLRPGRGAGSALTAA
jgi:hypothetical protein